MEGFVSGSICSSIWKINTKRGGFRSGLIIQKKLKHHEKKKEKKTRNKGRVIFSYCLWRLIRRSPLLTPFFSLSLPSDSFPCRLKQLTHFTPRPHPCSRNFHLDFPY
eukprot:snap_masked-scaffold_27-processed-gene-2.34-mRNA-1 protein AED:1.00 eAED:1.00 QI:0/0/0/0/1/1/2/0/106